MSINYEKQHALGLAGLALLRNWLVGDEKVIRSILDEIANISASDKDVSKTKKGKAVKHDVLGGYQVWAKTYDTSPNLLIEVEEPVVKSILKKLPIGRALDAACGTGRYSTFLHSLGHEVTGIDFSSAMLHQAKIREPNVNFIQGNLSELPLKTSSVDLIICALVFAHLHNIDETLSEFARVVRSGGKIIISDINPWVVALGAHAEFKHKEGEWSYVANNIYWHSTYIQAFSKAGLSIVRCEEPRMELKHAKLAQEGFKLSKKTVAEALSGLPMALVWVLDRP